MYESSPPVNEDECRRRTTMTTRKPDLLHVCRGTLVQTFLVIKFLTGFVQRDTFVLIERMLVSSDIIDRRAKNARMRPIFLVLEVGVNSQMPGVAAEFL